MLKCVLVGLQLEHFVLSWPAQTIFGRCSREVVRDHVCVYVWGGVGWGGLCNLGKKVGYLILKG